MRKLIPHFRVRRGFSTAAHTLDLSSDSARFAVLRLWDQAKELGGSFASEAQLRELMGRYYRFVPELRAKGWLDGLDVHDWDEDQVDPDPGARERQRRRRARLDGEGVTSVTFGCDVTPENVTNGRDVTPSPRARTPDGDGDGDRDRDGRGLAREDSDPEQAQGGDLPPLQNPTVEIATVLMQARARGWQVSGRDEIAVHRDFNRNPSRRACDYFDEWAAVAERKPITNPWAVAFRRQDGKPENATAVEIRTRRRRELAEHGGMTADQAHARRLTEARKSGNAGGLVAALVDRFAVTA